ncbi:MAG: NAD-binding protein [Dehalococcoidales bacterium]|nr:NAD-binding protein [Dehalococcoidales bacterium]
MIALACGSIVAEGFVLGAKAGIDPVALYEIVKVSTGNNWSLQQYPGTMLKGNFEPGFKISLAYKDINLALSLGEEYGVPLPVGLTVKKDLEEAIESGYAKKGVDAVILNLEKATGIQVRSHEK